MPRRPALALACAAAALLLRRAASAYSAGSLLLVRVQNGGGAAGTACPSQDASCSAAAPLFLDEYVPLPDGSAATLASSKPLPGVTLSSTDFYQGSLNLCADGTCAVLAATAAAPGTVPTAAAPYFAADRVVVRIAANGSVDTSTRVAASSFGGMIKGVCSFGANGGPSGYFIVGNATTSCVSYVAHGSAAGSGFVNAARGPSCATAQGPMDGAYTSCLATAATAPGTASFNRSLLFSRVFSDYALVDPVNAVRSPEALWTQTGGLTLAGTTTDVLDNGFNNAWYYSQIVASRSQDLFFLTDPFGGSCEIDICRGKDVFPAEATWTGRSGCGVHVSYLTYCAYSGVTFSLDEKLIYFTSRNRLISYPVAGGSGKVLVTLPPGQEFRGVSRAPFVCGGTGTGFNGTVDLGPVGSPVDGFYCPNGKGTPIVPCPAGQWSLAGALTTCLAPLPSPTPTPSPSPTHSFSPTPSVAPNGTCWAASTFAGPDWVTPNVPAGMALDRTKGMLYVADRRLHEIVQIQVADGSAQTFAGNSGVRGHADGVGTNALFRSPMGLALHETLGDLYIADTYFALIRRATPDGAVTTLVGKALPGGGGAVLDGDATTATFSSPGSLALDSAKDVLYVLDANGASLRAISGLHGTLSVATIAGSGVAGSPINSVVGTSARFSASTLGGLALDPVKGLLYVGDFNNHVIRLINLATSAVTTIAGTGSTGPPHDGTGANATFWLPAGVALNAAGTVLYVAEWQNAVIRSVAVGGDLAVPSGTAVTVLVGNTDLSDGVKPGVGASAAIPWPTHLHVDKASDTLYATAYFHATIARITPASATMQLLTSPAAVSKDGTGLNSRFSAITALAVDPSDNLIVVDHGASSVRKISPQGMTTTLAGGAGPGLVNGPLTAAKFLSPTGVAVDGSLIYVSDTGNRVIRVINVKPAAGAAPSVATLAGTGLAPAVGQTGDGDYAHAMFTFPCQIATFGGAVYVLDSLNGAWKPGAPPIKYGDALRKVAGGQVTTLAQSSGARFFNFAGAMSPIAVDPASGAVFFGDFWNSRLLQYTPQAGAAYAGAFSLPMGLAMDASPAALYPGTFVVTGGAWAAQRTSVKTFGSLGLAFGANDIGSVDGVFANSSFDSGVAGIQAAALAFDSLGNLFVAHTFHNKIMRVGKLTGAACNLAVDPNSNAHVCHPGTYISWASKTCLPCSAAASTYVFPFSSYCQDANGNVIAAPGAESVAAVAGVSVGAIVGGVVVLVSLLAVRAYYIINAPNPPRSSMKRRPSRGEGGAVATPNPLASSSARRIGGDGGGGGDSGARRSGSRRASGV